MRLQFGVPPGMEAGMRVVGAFFLGAFFASSSWLRADVLGDLSVADKARVKAGEQVMLTEALDGYPWPRVRVYQAVAAKPSEVMAVFFDYNNACHYIPNCTASKISKALGPRSFEVDYVVDVPILPDEAYTVRNELTGDGNGKMAVNWTILRATSILESNGSLAVEPLGEGAVLRYTNLLKPSSKAAFLLKGMAMGQMRDTVQAIIDQVKKQKANPASLKEDVTRLQTALKKE